MRIRTKTIIALVTLLAACAAGLYFSGWLATLLLGQYRVKLNWDTWWQYWQAIHHPRIPLSAALKVKIAGGLGFGLPAVLWLSLVYLLARSRGVSSLHGNARFATAGDLKKAGLFGSAPNGIVVGKWGSQLIRLGGQQFAILAAPTRSGKGVGIVIPNLLEYQESVVVLDIKRENFDLTSGWRKSQGHEIYLFNPFAEDRRTHRWNPLSYVSRDPAFRISDIQGIAAMLYPAVDDRQKFWVSHARNAFTAFALYLFEQMDERGGGHEHMPTLGQIYRLSSGQGGDIKEYLQGLAQEPFLSKHARAAFANLLSQEKETFASIIGSFKEPLNAWLNPVLDAATSGDDFDLSAVRKKKMTIYIGIQPGKLAESRVIVNLFFSQLIDVNTRELPQSNPALKYQCLLLMDEFTSIGRVDILAQAVAYMAGYNLRLLPIIQSMAQLDAVYGRELARTLITNHALQILYAPREQQDANDYSDMLGYTTVRQESRTHTRSRGQGRGQGQGWGWGREISRSEHEERRALMLPQELKALGGDKEVFLYEGIPHPVKCGKIRYYQDRRFAKRVMTKVEVPLLVVGEPKAPVVPDAQSLRSGPLPVPQPPLQPSWQGKSYSRDQNWVRPSHLIPCPASRRPM
jgi:type IV secretion system protein VirD4